MKILEWINTKAAGYAERYRGLGRIERNRFLVLLISLMLIADYLMFCYHTDKNIFNVFPALPEIDFRSDIVIHVPDLDAQTILKEGRRVLVPERKENYAALLYKMVAKGSKFENTAGIVPVITFVRNIWVSGNDCVIDVDYEAVKERIETVPGSDEAFRKALEKTITENIPGINKVHLLLNGIPRKLW